MKPDAYFGSLKYEQQSVYAQQAGTTAGYLRSHIFRKKGRSRNPSFEIIVGLVSASEGQVSLEEAIQYFLVDPVVRIAEEKLKNFVIKQGATEQESQDGSTDASSDLTQATACPRDAVSSAGSQGTDTHGGSAPLVGG